MPQKFDEYFFFTSGIWNGHTKSYLKKKTFHLHRPKY